MNDKTIVKKKIWSWEVIEYSDNTSEMIRTNDGFNVLEVLGLVEFVKDELLEQMKGNLKPTVVTRKVIKSI